MATQLQENLAREIIKNSTRKKPLNKKELVASVGYTAASADKKATEIIESKGVQEVLDDYGFNEDNAKKVVAEILLAKETAANDRLRAAEQVFKVQGSYAPEKKLIGTIALTDEHKQKGKSAVKRLLGN